jgi:DNA-binding transcriptional LysR family regulator
MSGRTDFDHIDLHLIRVLHTLITERSVSRAALRLQTSQPAVSAQLRRLRSLTGDALLVRAGQGMTPTERALQLAGPAAAVLQQAGAMFTRPDAGTTFDPRTSTAMVRVAASDYLDPLFLPDLVAHLKREAPGISIELLPLSGEFDYRRSLAAGEIDLVIGNWLEPPGELHLARLFSDEIVCLVADRHPVARSAGTRAWNTARYLACEHVAPTPLHPGARGVIDEHLTAQGLERRITVRSCHFSLIPLMVARSLLVLTTGRLFCSRYTDTLPVRVVRCPVEFPPLTYYQLWHDVTNGAATMRWFREQVRRVAHEIASHRLPSRGRPPP